MVRFFADLTGSIPKLISPNNPLLAVKQSSQFPLAARLAVILLPCLLAACGGGEKEPEELSPAANRLVAPAVEAKDTLPHKVDSATEFPAAMDSLAKGSHKPKLRSTSEATNVVRVEAVPAIQKGPAPAAAPSKPIEQDWDGTVLIPEGTQMSQAFTTDVKLTRIEAHPLTNNALRVWVRVQNITAAPLETRVACNFKSSSSEDKKTAFIPVTIAPEEAVDVYFMSPMPNVTNYTVLVR